MEIELNRLARATGNRNKYQYTTLLIAVLIWLELNVLNVSIPFLELMPVVSYKDPDTQVFVKDVELSYDICEKVDHETILVNKVMSKRSWVIDHKIYCSRTLTGLIGSSLSLGLLVGGLLNIFLLERLGRKRTLIISVVGYTITIFLFNFVISNIYLVYTLEVMLGIWSNNSSMSSLVYMQEVTDKDLSSIYTGIINASYACGGIINSLMYKFFDNWKINFNTSFGFGILVSIYITLVLVESPKFYFLKGRFIDFLESFKRIAKFNDLTPAFEYWIANNFNRLEKQFYYEEVVEVPENPRQSNPGEVSSDLTLNIRSFIDNSCEHLNPEIDNHKEIRDKVYRLYAKNCQQESTIVNSQRKIYRKRETKPETGSFFDLVRYSSQRYTFLILCYIWFIQNGIYDGLGVFLKKLDGDIYINGIILYSLDFASFVIAGFLINIKVLGRVKSMLLMYCVALIGYILLVFVIEIEKSILQTVIALGARFAISGIFTILYTFTAEVYPASLSVKGFSINWLMAKSGSIIGQLLLEWLEENILYVMFGTNLLCCVLVPFLPETFGKEKPNDIPEKINNLIESNPEP